jgi:hypothetical protein
MTRRTAFADLAIFLAVPTLCLAQSELGTWKLNTAKSTYTGTAMPKSRTITIEPRGDGVMVHTEGVAGDGTKDSYSYTAKYDGKNYPVTGAGTANGGDMVAIKRIDADTVELTWTKGGKVVNTVRRSISKDGKIMTTTGKGTSPDGKPTSASTFYDKQ